MSQRSKPWPNRQWKVEVLLMGEHLHMLTQGRVEQNGLKSRSRRCVGLAGYLGHPYAR